MRLIAFGNTGKSFSGSLTAIYSVSTARRAYIHCAIKTKTITGIDKTMHGTGMSDKVNNKLGIEPSRQTIDGDTAAGFINL
jgi:hypothetical protein